MESKYRRKERYQAIYDAFEPFRQAKKDTIHSIMSYGKKQPILKYPVLLMAVVFIFVYNFFMHLFIQLHVREKLARGLALAMTVVIVITSVDVTALAMKKVDNQGETVTISQISELEEDILTQEIMVGETIEKVVFPDSIVVTVQEVVEMEDPAEEEGKAEIETQEPIEKEPEVEGQEPTEGEPEVEEPTVDESEPTVEPEPEPTPEPTVEPQPEPTPEPVAEPIAEPTPEVEVGTVGDSISSLMELFQPMKVYAAETEPEADSETEAEPVPMAEFEEEAEQIQYKESVVSVPVTWELDIENSSHPEFSSENAGDSYVYRAVLEDSYVLLDGVTMPEITVVIVEAKITEQKTKLYEVFEIEGVAVEVSADEGVFPAGATVSVLPVSNESVLHDVSDAIASEKASEAARGAERETIPAYEEEIIAFDITVYDKEGNEIQPNTENGEVKVRFHVLSDNQENMEAQMFCVDEGENVELLDTTVDTQSGMVEAGAQHFSVYGVSIMTYAAKSSNVTIGGYDESAKSLAGVLVAGDEIFEIENAKRTGTVYRFSNGKSDLGIETGIVLDSSGRQSAGKDSQLDGIRDSRFSYGGHTSTLEFEATANGELLNFNYVFASAEFNQAERYNDCFGLFVKINNGSWQNIAKISRSNGSKVPVSIKNLRAGVSGTEMNGGTSTNLAGSHSLFTKKSVYLNGTTNGVSNVFNAQLPVKVGDKVKIKFAICDISDTAMNSWVFIESGSLNFKGPKKTMSYTDANGNTQIIEAEEGEMVKAPEALSQDGFNFLGWNTKENGSGTTYQPGEEFPLLSDMSLYPMWELIMNTTQVQLFLDGEAWGGQKVALYKGGVYEYTLTETVAGSGIYANAKVTEGDYDIYVNDRKSDEGFSVHPTKVSLYLKQDVKYALLNIETTLDGVTASVGEIGLYQNGSVVHEIPASEGIYQYPILESETPYGVYVDGTDTGVVIGVNDKDKVIDFHTIEVSIEDDAPWLKADVVLRDSSGGLAAVLSATKTDGNIVTYTKILAENTEKEYAVFIAELDTHKTVKACENFKNIEMTYYTARVILQGSVPENATAVMSNGYESYTFSANTENVCIAEHVMIHVEDGEELLYEATIKNTVDNVKETVNSSKKEIILTYRLVSMFTCMSSKNPTTHKYEYNYDTEAFRKTYVRHGSSIPPYDGKIALAGHAFDFWSEIKWDPEAETENIPFDFVNTKIEKDYVLYANYAIPTVIIGDVVKTSEAGTINGIGPCYRMANLTISGFDKGEDAIKYIFFTTSYTKNIQILDGTVNTANIILDNGTAFVDTSEGGNYTIIPTGDKVAITFKEPVSMSKAQDFLRNQIIVKPQVEVLHTMQIEILDGKGEYVAPNAVKLTPTSGTATELTTTVAKNSLTSGNYYLNKSTTFGSETKYGVSGLTIANNATVYIYIPENVTLTAIGGHASGTTGAGAGIHVPYNSTLVFIGQGSVTATGGDAAPGTGGSSAESGKVYSGSGVDGRYYGGNGGSGGSGGGGAGAGIGGSGGYGGYGGSGGYGNAGSDSSTIGGNKNAYGASGSVGGNGGDGGSCGTIYILDAINVTAKGGKENTSQSSGGSAGTTDYDSFGFDGKKYHVAGGGGGGGGGGSGYGAAALGAGGAGGGGGGGGGEGAVDYSTTEYSTSASGSSCDGGGGSAGGGRVSGNSGVGTRDSGKYDSAWDQEGGTGGSGGSAGSSGSVRKSYIANTAKLNGNKGDSTDEKYVTYEICFETPSDTAEDPAKLSYTYGHSYKLTLPKYTDINENVQFLGWQLSTHPKSGIEGSPLTTETAKRYRAGETVELVPTTYGNIVFTAVTETIGGIRDDDNTSQEFIYNGEEGKADTYYTYNVVITVDDEIDKNRGKIKIGDNYVAPGADGTYTLIATKNVTLDISIGGTKVGETKDFSNLKQYESNTTIAYETLKVEIEGKVPDTVVLEDGPILLDEGNSQGNRKYSCERLTESNSGSWEIIVDGENCGQTASYGTTTIVDYNTVTVSITKQGNAAETISSVELRDANNGSIFLTKNASNKYVHTKLAANKGYTLYINGEKTDVTTDFSQNQNIEVTYSRYRTMIKTTVDGILVDMGTVFFGNTKMIRRGVGTYELTTTDNAVQDITVDGKLVKESVTPGMEHEVQYFTLTYEMSGMASGVEAGELPKDNRWYLSGEEASLIDNIGLTNGYMTFAGWKIGDTVYEPAEKAPITATTVAKASWIPTYISLAEITVEDVDFVYDGTSQIPEVVVTKDGLALKKNVHYQLSYTNSNSGNGKGVNNTINAGEITITITGINEFTGSEDRFYEIGKRDIILDGITAVGREYNGTTEVTLDKSNKVLTGYVAGDEVDINSSNIGHVEFPDADEEQVVAVDAANYLEGAAKDNYELRPSKSIKVNITKKPMTDAMFTLDTISYVYDGQKKEPNVTATDMNGSTNIISSQDYTVAYTNNVRAGTATVTITATEDGNYSGSVTKTFEITKAPLTVAAQEANSVYGEEISSVKYLVTEGEIYTEEDRQQLDIKAITSVKKGYDAKVYQKEVTVSYKEHPDYAVTTVPANYTVTKAEDLEVISYDYVGKYDGQAHSMRVAAKPYKSDETITVYYSENEELTQENYVTAGDTVNPSFTEAGKHKVYYYAVSNNYVGTGGSATVNITKAPLTITANAQSIVYGEDVTSITDKTIAANVTLDGLVEADKKLSIDGDVTFTSSDYQQYGDVGIYSVTAMIAEEVMNGSMLKNYEITYVSGNLTVNPKPVTFTWNTTALPYIGSMQGIFAQITGVENSDDVAVVYENDETYKQSAVDVGGYTAKIAALTGSKASNYTFTNQSQGVTKDWSITKVKNDWIIAPSIQGWTEEQTPNNPIGSAKFGKEITYHYYSYSKEENAYKLLTMEPADFTYGTYYMKATVGGTDHYSVLETDYIEFTVAKKPGQDETKKQVLYVIPAPQEITYGEDVPETVAINYYSDEEGTIEVTPADGEISTKNLICTTDYKKGDASRGNVGTYMLVARGLSSSTYDIVYKTGQLTVVKKVIGLDWPDNRKLPYNGKEQTVTAEVTGFVNNDQVYVSEYENNGNVATNVGKYEAEAKKLAGDKADNYELPAEAAYRWEIIQANNTFVVEPSIADWTYGETASTPIAKAAFGNEKVTYQYKKAAEGIADWAIFNPAMTEVPKDAGDYVLLVSVEEADEYTGIDEQVRFTIHQAEVVIAAQDATREYGTALGNNTLTYTFGVTKGVISEKDKSKLEVGLSTDAIDGVAEGTYPIHVTYTENPNIKVIKVGGTYTITKAKLKTEASDVTVTYDGEPHGIEVFVKDLAGYTIENAEVYYSFEELSSENYGNGSFISPALTDAGTDTIYYYVKADNYQSKAGSATVTINKKEVTVTAKDAKITYGEAPINNGVEFVGLVAGDSAEELNHLISYNYQITTESGVTPYIKGSPVGSYEIVPISNETTNYTFKEVSGTLTVTRKTLTEEMVTLASETYTYDATEKKPDVTVTDGSILKSSDYAVTYEKNINAGENTAKAIITATENGNYTGMVERNFSIAKKDATITAVSATSVYNEDVAEVSYNQEGILAQDIESLKLKAVTSVRKGYDVGNYTEAISVSYKENDNYNITVIPADYMVTNATLTVTAEGYKGTYDGNAYGIEVNAKTGKFLTYAQIYYGTSTVDANNYQQAATTSPTFKDAGTHTVYYYVVCDNFTPQSGYAQVIIEKAPLTAQIPNTEELTYGKAPSEVLKNLNPDDITYRGFVGDDTVETVIKEGSAVTFISDYTQYGNVGTYAVTAKDLETDNYEITYQPGALKVVPNKVSFTWPEITTFAYDGNDKQIVAGIEGLVNQDAVAVVYEADAENQILNRANAVGSYTAKVSALSGIKANNYTFDSSDASKKWKIEKAVNSWTIEPSISGWVAGETPNAPIAASKYGTPKFTYSDFADGSYAVKTADQLQGLSAGTYYMKASVPASANYEAVAESDPVAFTITSVPETGGSTDTVVYVKAVDKSINYGDAVPTFTYSATKKDGTTVTLADVATGTVEYTTNYVQGSSVGTYTVVPKDLTAKQGYTLVYQPGSLTVNKKQVSLTWSANTFTYNGKTRTVTATVTEGLVGADSILATGYAIDMSDGKNVTNSAVNAGTYTAKAISFSGVNVDNYEVSTASASHTWTITKAESDDGTGSVAEGANVFIIAPAISGWTYGETPNAPVGSAKYGIVEFTYSTSQDGVYTSTQPTNAGTYYMKATVAGTDNYGGLSKTIEFTITKAPITIIADDKSSAQGKALTELTYVMSGNIKEGDDLHITLTTDATNTSVVGEYPITVSYDTSNTNYQVKAVNGNYFITAQKDNLEVTASGYAGEYDGKAHGITVSVQDKNGNAVEDAVVYYSETKLTTANYGRGKLTSPTFTDACEKTVYYYVETPNHEPKTGHKTVSIQKKEVTVTANPHTIVYGEAPSNHDVQYTGFVGNDTEITLGLTPAYTYTYEQFEDVGSYQICPEVAETTNYKFTAVKGNLEVTQKPVTFTWSSDGFVYDASKKVVTAQVMGAVNGDDVRVDSYVTNTSAQIQNSAVPVGQYTATVNSLGGENAANYKFEQTDATANHVWAITEATNFFTVAPSIADWNYGETASVPQATSAYGTIRYEYSNSMYGEYSAVKPLKAGTYYMKAIVDPTADYGVLESSPIPFTVNKAEICVTAEDKFSKPGEQLQRLTYVVTGNVVAGEKLEVTLETEATPESVVGNYPIIVSVEASENYKISKINGQYYISEQDYSITAEGVNVQYDGKYHGIKVNVKDSDGNAAEDVKVYYSEMSLDSASITDWSSLSTTSPIRRDAGTTKVYYYIVKEGEVILSGEKSITVTRAALTVTAKDAMIVVGNKPINHGVIYEGFVNQEDETFLTGALSYRYDYNENLSDGTYCITPSGLMSKNYDITFKNGVLTVLPIPEEVEIFITPQNGVYNANAHIGYTGHPSTAQGDITEFEYVYRDANEEELSGAPMIPGTYTLTVTIPKDHLYYRGSKTITFTIDKAPITVKVTDQAMYAEKEFEAVKAKYCGFVGNDTEDSIFTTKPAVSIQNITGTSAIPAGTYVLVANTGVLTDAADDYYEVNIVPGKLVVFPNPNNDSDGTDDDSNVSVEKDASIKLDQASSKSGLVETVVLKHGDAPPAKLETNLTVEKAEELLDVDEEQKVKDGANALIYLLWSDVDENANVHEVHDISQTAEDKGMKVGLFMDASLFKVIDGGEPEKISKVNNTAVIISVKLPVGLKNTNPNMMRTYHIIYEHNGIVNYIEPFSYNAVSHELEFEAHEFSVYSIAYKDVAVNNAGNNSGNHPGGDMGDDFGNNYGGGYDDGSDYGSDSENESAANDKNATNTEDTVKDNEKSKEGSGFGKKPSSGSDKNPANGKDKESGQSSEKNQNNTVEDAKDPGSQEGQKQPEKTLMNTPKAETIDSISKEKEEQLKDALEELQKKTPSLQPGPFIKVVIDPSVNAGEGAMNGNGTIGGGNTSNGTGTAGGNAINGNGTVIDENTMNSAGITVGEDGKVKFTINIPEEIAKEGRTYYLVTVDEDGNIVVLQNESIVNGLLTFAGDPNATYQIVYEDGGATLPELLNENGWLVDENGKYITVDTNHCFLHYFILLLAAMGILLTLFFRGKQKKQLLIIGIDAIVMILLTLIGWCTWDMVFTILSVVIMFAIFLWSKKKKDSDELSYE